MFPINEWHHVALTLKHKIQTLYIDSQQKNQVTLSDYPIYTISPLAVGGFTGQLYNFQFSNYAMTQEQVKIAMGQHPDETYNDTIRQIWRNTGCLSNPIPEDQPNKYPEWKTLIKNDQKSRVEGIIQSIKKKADDGDKKTQQVCYGKFTAGMLDKLAEREKLLQYTLEKEKDGVKCLPVAPFDCKQKTINDFDIRTHKDFNKYTLSTKIQPVFSREKGCLANTKNLDLSQLKNNQVFMETLAEIKQNAMKTKNCNHDQIMNSFEYQDLKKQTVNFNAELKKTSKLTQQTVGELEKTKRMAVEILKNINHLNIDEKTAQKLLTTDVNDPSFKNLIDQIRNAKNKSEQNTLQHVKCWGCELPKSIPF